MASNLMKKELKGRYGGIKAGPAFFGWLSAMGVSAIMLAFLSGVGALAFNNQQVNQANASVAGVALLITLAVAYYAGGYVAGRMNRFSGGIQGLGVWLMGIVAGIITTALGVALGVNFGLLQSINTPAMSIEGSTTLAGLAALLVAAAVALIAAMAGGKVGEEYHHKIDRDAEMIHRHQRAEANVPKPSMDRLGSPSFGETIDNRNPKNRDRNL